MRKLDLLKAKNLFSIQLRKLRIGEALFWECYFLLISIYNNYLIHQNGVIVDKL